MRFCVYPMLLIGCSVETNAGEHQAAQVPAGGIELARALGRPPPPSCEGPRIDLGALSECRCGRQLEVRTSGTTMVRAGAWCGEAFDGAVSAGIEAHAQPTSAAVAPGAAVGVLLSFRNRARAPAPLRFRGSDAVLRVQVLDAEERDVTQTGACGHGSSGPSDEYLVVVAPGGEAVRRVRWVASHLHGEPRGDECVEERRPYAPGTYRVLLHTALQGAAPDVASPTLVVTVR